MGYSHERIKSNAKLFYKNNTGSSILSVLIFLGVTFGAIMALYFVMFIFGLIFGVSAGVAGSSNSGGAAAAAAAGGVLFSLLVMAAYIAVILGLYPLSIGLMGWYRKSIYEKTSLAEIFSPYKKEHLWSNIGTMFLMQIYTFLWSLLFLIPGIIKSYSYSQTAFIKSENPNISASRAIELSKIMMEGHKGELFYLHLSFLGWMLLSSLTYNILGVVYVYPYFYGALAFAYEEIKADAIARGIIDPTELSGPVVM